MFKFGKFIIFVLVFFIWFSNQVCYTNSLSEEMAGNTIYPINNNNIRLESQSININYNAFKENHYNFHQIEAIFNLHNTDNATELEIGFPNITNYDEKLKGFEVLSYPELIPFDVTLNFKEGKILSGIDKYYYSSYYSWTVPFEQHQKQSLLIRYNLKNINGVNYILKTGALWKGRIDEIDINVEFPEPISFLEIDAQPENYYYNGKGMQWQFKNIEPNFDLYIKHIPVPKSYQLENKFFTPYQREDDIYRWDKSLFYINTLLEDFDIYLLELAEKEQVLTKIKKQLDICELIRNEIFARNGYIFSDSKWDDFFSIQSWYEPDVFFEYDKLNQIEKINIKQILEFEDVMKNLEDKNFDEIIKKLKEYSLKHDIKHNTKHKTSSNNIKANDFKTDNSNINDFSTDNSTQVNTTYLKVIEQQKQIEKNRKSFKELIIIPEKFTEFETEYTSNNLSPIDIKDLDMTNMYTYINGIIKITDDNSDTLFIDKDDSICRLTNLESMKVRNISPNGKYVIMSGNNISGFVSSDIYLISTLNGIAYLIGKGDYNDYQFIWSFNDSLQYRNFKKEANVIKHFNSQNGIFSTRVIPISDFESFYISKDNAAVLQSGNTIYYMNKQKQSIKQIIEDGNLMGFCPSNNKILFYRGCKIYEHDLINNITTKLVSLEYPIWQTQLIHNNMYVIYSGSDIIFCYNYNANTLNKFYNIADAKDIKISPGGDKLLFHKDDYSNSSIMYADSNLKTILNLVSYIMYADSNLKTILNTKNANSIWIDNDNFVTYSYDQDAKDIIKTNTCVMENSTEYYNTYSKSINNKSKSIFNIPIVFNKSLIYVCIILLIILSVIYWLYKKKIKASN